MNTYALLSHKYKTMQSVVVLVQARSYLEAVSKLHQSTETLGDRTFPVFEVGCKKFDMKQYDGIEIKSYITVNEDVKYFYTF